MQVPTSAPLRCWAMADERGMDKKWRNWKNRKNDNRNKLVQMKLMKWKMGLFDDKYDIMRQKDETWSS